MMWHMLLLKMTSFIVWFKTILPSMPLKRSLRSPSRQLQMQVSGLKSRWIAQVNATANSILAQTDWMLVRKIERSVDVPSATVAIRAAVVTESNRLVAAITAASNITDFISAVQSANWSVAQ